MEKEEEAILETEDGAENPVLMDIYDRIEELDAPTFEKRAGELLYGLGFKKVILFEIFIDCEGNDGQADKGLVWWLAYARRPCPCFVCPVIYVIRHILTK